MQTLGNICMVIHINEIDRYSNREVGLDVIDL